MELQSRIVRLLGRLGGSNIHLIGAMNVAAQSTESGIMLNNYVIIFSLSNNYQEMAWDPTPRVKFTVPFPDIKTDIYLDSVLPRVVILLTPLHTPSIVHFLTRVAYTRWS